MFYKRNYEARDGDIDGIWLLFDTKRYALKVDFPKHKFKTKDVAGKSTLNPTITTGFLLP